MAELLPKTEIDDNVEIFTFRRTIFPFISSLINNKKLNIYQGLDEEIFLRELIFNSNDALHAIRNSFIWKSYYYDKFDMDLYIKIVLNEIDHTLTIIDNGIGMTKMNLINHLGNIKKIDNAADLHDLAVDDILTVIGFHSVYLVADKIIVNTKKILGEQYLWESDNTDNSYTIRCNNNKSLLHGTKVVLHIRKDQFQYLKESKIKHIIKKYSQFIEFPIKLIVQKKHKGKLSENKIEKTKNKSKNKKLESKNKKEWNKEKNKVVEELILPKPLWTKNCIDIQMDDYAAFYKLISKDRNKYFALKHCSTNGVLNYTTLFFIPQYESNVISKKYRKSVRLYIRRVLVMIDYRKLLPEYLKFIRGVINCEDVPTSIHKKQHREPKISDFQNIIHDFKNKVLTLLKDMTKYKDKYNMFYEQFSSSIKLGIVDDEINRSKLMQLLRYYTTASGDEMCSLKDYVSRMRNNQKYIYFIYSNNTIHENLKNAVFVEYVRKQGCEVIYMFDAQDEYIVKFEFNGKIFMSATNI